MPCSFLRQLLLICQLYGTAFSVITTQKARVLYAPIEAISATAHYTNLGLTECMLRQKDPGGYFQFHSGNGTCSIGTVALPHTLETDRTEGRIKVMVAPSFSRCPPTFIYAPDSNTCFFVNANHRVYWDEARSTCQQKGADLASIHSTAENDFIQSE